MGDVTLDTSDVDRWVGVPLGGGYLKEPVHVNDIRRWVQGMQNPNPIYYDDRFAAEGRFERIVAPQSFAVATDVGHGATPAIQGTIPGSHMIFGGDEWWFFGPRIEPGDRLKGERMLFDYRVTETKFAGPTMFSRGRHHLHQPARRDGRQAALDVDPLPRRGGAQARPVQREGRPGVE
jgi:hypothetical protein